MKGLARSVLLLLLLCGCAPAGPPRLQPVACSDRLACAAAWPEGRRQFVHLIEFRLPDGTGSTVIGITILDGRTIKCALTTTEGMTLFQATDNGRLRIIHALPPFDKPGFAAGLMGDVRAIFLRPPGTPRCGLFDNKPGCRFQDEHSTTDVVLTKDGCPQITTWTASGRPTRTITARDCSLSHGYRLGQTLVLRAPGAGGYMLTMTLLNAEPLPEKNEHVKIHLQRHPLFY